MLCRPLETSTCTCSSFKNQAALRANAASVPKTARVEPQEMVRIDFAPLVNETLLREIVGIGPGYVGYHTEDDHQPLPT